MRSWVLKRRGTDVSKPPLPPHHKHPATNTALQYANTQILHLVLFDNLIVHGMSTATPLVTILVMGAKNPALKFWTWTQMRCATVGHWVRWRSQYATFRRGCPRWRTHDSLLQLSINFHSPIHAPFKIVHSKYLVRGQRKLEWTTFRFNVYLMLDSKFA